MWCFCIAILPYISGSSMKNLAVFFIMLAMAIYAAEIKADPEDKNTEQWTVMPAGARPSYMGIHGGTMPVSLLVADDGSSLVSFVGRTGNDFINVIKKAQTPLPSFGNGTLSIGMRSKGSQLFAGNATASLPVVSIADDALAGLERHLQPFGLSEVPLSIEGKVAKPQAFPHAKSFRTFFLPDYFSSGKKH